MRLGYTARTPSKSAFSQAPRKLVLVDFAEKGAVVRPLGADLERAQQYSRRTLLQQNSWFYLVSSVSGLDGDCPGEVREQDAIESIPLIQAILPTKIIDLNSSLTHYQQDKSMTIGKGKL